MAHEAGGLPVQATAQPRTRDVDAGEPAHQQLRLLLGMGGGSADQPNRFRGMRRLGVGCRHSLTEECWKEVPATDSHHSSTQPSTSGSRSRLVTSSWMRTPGNALRSTCSKGRARGKRALTV